MKKKKKKYKGVHLRVNTPVTSCVTTKSKLCEFVKRNIFKIYIFIKYKIVKIYIFKLLRFIKTLVANSD